MGSIGNTQRFIISYNSDGQELRIPRSTYESRLEQAINAKESYMNQVSYPGGPSKRINPDVLRRYDQQIAELRRILETGKA